MSVSTYIRDVIPLSFTPQDDVTKGIFQPYEDLCTRWWPMALSCPRTFIPFCAFLPHICWENLTLLVFLFNLIILIFIFLLKNKRHRFLRTKFIRPVISVGLTWVFSNRDALYNMPDCVSKLAGLNLHKCWVLRWYLWYRVKIDCKTFRIFAYAWAVKQKVWNEAENRERDCFFFSLSSNALRACEARALRARKTLTPRFYWFLYWFWEKNRLFCSLS